MKIGLKISQSVCDELRAEIIDGNGNEVFAAGYLDENGIVDRIIVAARGHSRAVPVVPTFIEGSDVLIHNHPSSNLNPSDPDLEIAARAADACCGFYIINNAVTDVYVVVEPIRQKKVEKIDSAAVSDLLSETGPLAAESDHYESRPSQINLTHKIASTFNDSGIGVYEAGTGVGKSYAYLIPALCWAAKNNRRVVISTGTVNLQHQLMEKDIPAAEAITGKNIKAVLVKGRQNYICKRRLRDALMEPDLFDNDDDELPRIAEWAKTSETGSRSELTFMPSSSVWSRVNSESDACMGMRCQYRESCFVLSVRKAAASANLLVVNHHLLFSDIQARMGGAGFDSAAVLPSYHHLIFDEAHGIEDAATSFFSESFNRFKIQKQIALLYRTQGSKVRGHIFTLERLSVEASQTAEVGKTVELLRIQFEKMEHIASSLMQPFDYTFRLSQAVKSKLGELLLCMQEFSRLVAIFTGMFRSMISTISEEDQEQQVVWETKTILKRIEFVGVLCKSFAEWEEKFEWVFWIERNKTSRGIIYFRFVMTPLSVASMMCDGVFEPLDSVVCVSATLQIARSFNYWMHRCGVFMVDQQRLTCGVFESPFPYKTNVLLSIPSDAPPPDSRECQSYLETAIVSLLQASNGRALVLFTSYESLRLCCDVARSELQSLGITIYKQGDDDRSRLLESFKQNVSSVLFATDSFWEGVDIPGESLSHVIIAKLPFKVPNDPVLQARTEAITARGGNAFMELSLPEAVMRLKQGFGRLLRAKSDRGVVTILDTRLLTKQYGRIFLESLPESKNCFKPLAEILDSISRFLDV